MQARLHITVKGAVQGVGFRPFVYKLAASMELTGWVLNSPQGVFIEAEGDDKPLKYPKMFRNASILVINKIDLLPYVNCNIDELRKNALQINPHLKIFEISCTSGEGIDKWCGWINERIQKSEVKEFRS